MLLPTWISQNQKRLQIANRKLARVFRISHGPLQTLKVFALVLMEKVIV